MCRACALSISAPRLSARHSSFSCFSQLSAHKFLPAMSDQGHLTLLNLLRTDRLAREERHSVYWLMPSCQGVRITTNLLVTGIRWVSLTVRCREQRVHWLAEREELMFFQFLLRWWSLSCTVAETITPIVKLVLPMCLQFSPFFTSRTKTSFNNFSWILRIKRGSLPVSASQAGGSEAQWV